VFVPVCSFQTGDNQKTLNVCAEFMRVSVSGRVSGSPLPFSANADVAGPESETMFGLIGLPAGNGDGPSVDISDFPVLATFIAGGEFQGARILVEISEDGADWVPLVQFSGKGGFYTRTVTANFVRASVSGRKATVPFSGSLAIGATGVGSGGPVTGLVPGEVLFGEADGTIGQDPDLFWADTTKRLGVGTAAPTTKLDVAGTTRTTDATIASMTEGSLLFAGAAGAVTQDNSNLFWANTTKRLGIGTAAPTTAVDVAGTVRATTLQQPGLTTGSVLFAGASGAIAQDNSQLFWDDTANALGIGTATPGVFFGSKFAVLHSTDHAIASVISLGVGTDAVLILGTFTPGDVALFCDESDSIKLKVALGDVTTDAARLANTKVTIQQDGSVGIGVTTIGNYMLQIHQAAVGEECIKIRATNTGGYSDMVWFDSADVQKGGIGFGNSTVPNTLASLNFFFSPGAVDWVMSDAVTNWFRWYATTGSVGFEMANGGSAAVSLASTGKLRYNTTGQIFQTSLNGAAYFNVPQLEAALTSGSVVFANSSGRLAQDNANLFWDDTNNRLGINDATPSEALDVTGSINMTVSLFRGGTKVVGAQGAAVADAAGGATVDTEARTAINDLLARLRASTGHGLIAG
jgi:hypothetical protein